LAKIEKKNFLEAYRFLLVGLCSVTIDFLFYYIFIHLNFLDPNNSKRLSFILGASFAFFANRSFVFKVEERKITQYIYFSILYFTSFIFNSLVHDYTYLFTKIIFLSFLVATGVSTIINFIGQKFIIFKKIETNKND